MLILRTKIDFIQAIRISIRQNVDLRTQIDFIYIYRKNIQKMYRKLRILFNWSGFSNEKEKFFFQQNVVFHLDLTFDYQFSTFL